MSATNKKDKNPETPTLEQFEGFKEEITTAVEELRATVQALDDRQTGYMAKINGRMDDIQENMRESEHRMMEAMENRMMTALERFYIKVEQPATAKRTAPTKHAAPIGTAEIEVARTPYLLWKPQVLFRTC
jgi:hypothetical protein